MFVRGKNPHDYMRPWCEAAVGYYIIEKPKKIEGKIDGSGTVTVNYNLTLEDVLKAGNHHPRVLWKNMAGHTDRVRISRDYSDYILESEGRSFYSIIAEQFPSKRKGVVEQEMFLVRFNWSVKTDEVIRQFDSMGLRPAELPEGLSFGKKYRKVQEENEIVILGSIWQGPRDSDSYCVVLLGSRQYDYWLDMRWVDGEWGDFRIDIYPLFLAVRK